MNQQCQNRLYINVFLNTKTNTNKQNQKTTPLFTQGRLKTPIFQKILLNKRAKAVHNLWILIAYMTTDEDEYDIWLTEITANVIILQVIYWFTCLHSCLSSWPFHKYQSINSSYASPSKCTFQCYWLLNRQNLLTRTYRCM